MCAGVKRHTQFLAHIRGESKFWRPITCKYQVDCLYGQINERTKRGVLFSKGDNTCFAEPPGLGFPSQSHTALTAFAHAGAYRRTNSHAREHLLTFSLLARTNLGSLAQKHLAVGVPNTLGTSNHHRIFSLDVHFAN